jgi:hypothetical protein
VPKAKITTVGMASPAKFSWPVAQVDDRRKG